MTGTAHTVLFYAIINMHKASLTGYTSSMHGNMAMACGQQLASCEQQGGV